MGSYRTEGGWPSAAALFLAVAAALIFWVAGLGQKISLTPCQAAKKERECAWNELTLFKRETRCFTMQVAKPHFQGKRIYHGQNIFYLGVDSEVMTLAEEGVDSVTLLDISAIY